MKRRDFVAGMAATQVLLSSIATVGFAHGAQDYDAMVPTPELPPDYLPREVVLEKPLPPFEIHVEPSQFALYWTLPEGRAMRFTVGIGRQGLYHSGEYYIGAKKEWPSWTPTPAMIRRDPGAYARYADGMAGGLANPLGARALYLFQPGRGDTFLRIHGTSRPETIGRQVSNGCARLTNDQIIAFYDRVPMETRVVLNPLPGAG